MKKLLTLVILLALIAAGYTMFWVNTTDSLKQRVIQFADSHGITYDAIAKAGYPFGAEVILTNPKNAANLHRGTVSVGSSLFDIKKMWITLAGTTEINHNESTLSGTTTLKCNYCIKENLTIELPEPLTDMHVQFTDITLANKTGDVLKINQGLFTLKNELIEGFNNFSLGIDAKGFTYNPNNEINHKFFSNFTDEELDALKSDPSDIGFEAHGKIPAFQHPFYMNPSFENLPPFFTFVIDKSYIKSPLYTSTSDGSFEFKKEPDQFKAVMKMDGESVITDKLKPRLIKIVKTFSKDQKALTQLISENASELIPDFTRFGAIKSTLDASFAGNPSTGIIGASLDLRNFELASKPYGLKLNGQASLLKSDFTISLLHYLQLFSDVRHYYNKWQRILVESGTLTPKEMPVLSTRFQELVVKFLESFSESKDKERLEITFGYSPQEITIGAKNITQVMESYSQLVSDLKEEFEKESTE
jgi:hypothetical protein